MIPEILRGKEVKEFTKLLADDIRTNPDGSHYTATIEEEELFELNDFYEQPFTPEMILDFEGWEVAKDYSNKYISKENNFEIWIHEEAGTIQIWNNEGERFTYKYPQTRSQFITCCLMAGLKLTWRK